MICCDTNVFIAFLNRRPVRVEERFRLALAGGVRLAMPIIALYELRHGAKASAKPKDNEASVDDLLTFGIEVLDFGQEDARHAADIYARLRRQGTPIGPYDVLIAAQARARGATLVTANMREFARVPDLSVEDWSV
jgi:tRNA(fMet)-specific endonuclease VapC